MRTRNNLNVAKLYFLIHRVQYMEIIKLKLKITFIFISKSYKLNKKE